MWQKYSKNKREWKRSAVWTDVVGVGLEVEWKLSSVPSSIYEAHLNNENAATSALPLCGVSFHQTAHGWMLLVHMFNMSHLFKCIYELHLTHMMYLLPNVFPCRNLSRWSLALPEMKWMWRWTRLLGQSWAAFCLSCAPSMRGSWRRTKSRLSTGTVRRCVEK